MTHQGADLHRGGVGARRALLIGNDEFADPTFAPLMAPLRDVEALASVLSDPDIGGFEVRKVLNASEPLVRREILGFLSEGSSKDTVLLYFSCHGLKDAEGELYLAMADTEARVLEASGLSTRWVEERLTSCRARSKIVIVDACHSGAFARGAKGVDAMDVAERFSGKGRFVLTSSRSTQVSMDSHDNTDLSRFTEVIVEGLRSGEADRDLDGAVTPDDLYHYVYDRLRDLGESQVPERRIAPGSEGSILLARSVRPDVAATGLDPEILQLIESPLPRAILAGIGELGRLLANSNPQLADTARLHLQKLATEADSLSARSAAEQALSGEPPATAEAVEVGDGAESGIDYGTTPELDQEEPEPTPAQDWGAPTEDHKPSKRNPLKKVLLAVAAVVFVSVVTVLLRLRSEDPIYGYGDDPDLDALWDACDGGDFQACDDLYFQGPSSSEYEQFGDTCGDRDEPEGFCVDVYADPELDALYDQCADGDFAACDELFAFAPVGSEYEQFGYTCGDRGEPEGFCVERYG